MKSSSYFYYDDSTTYNPDNFKIYTNDTNDNTVWVNNPDGTGDFVDTIPKEWYVDEITLLRGRLLKKVQELLPDLYEEFVGIEAEELIGILLTRLKNLNVFLERIGIDYRGEE